MTMARVRPPTDELETAIYDGPRHGRRRPAKSTKRGHDAGELATPTAVDRDRSEPLRVISMKAASDAKPALARKQHKAEIRSLSDVAGANATPPMGYLAPPVDLKQRNVRKLRDWLIWGSVLVMISCVVMLAVWFLAGR